MVLRQTPRMSSSHTVRSLLSPVNCAHCRYSARSTSRYRPLASEARDESLELGMADTLITKLGTLRSVTVRPISAVRRYTSLEQDPVAAGREIGVEAVLDGSIQH